MATLLIQLVKLSALVEQLLALSVKGLLILMVAAGLCYGLRRASAAARHLVWTVALASLIALPALSLALPSWQIALLPASAAEQVTGATTVTAEPITPSTITRHKVPAEASVQMTTASDEQPGKANKEMLISQSEIEPVVAEKGSGLKPEAVAGLARASFDWSRMVLIIWLAAALLVLARLFIGTISVWRLRRTARKIDEGDWTCLATEIRSRIGLRRRVLLLESERITMPITCGLLRPAVLLPARSGDWSTERRQVVLLHELAHVKRWDCLTQLLGQLACAIYWFNPMVWIMARKLRIERELACDDQVLDAGTKASDYADHLLNIAHAFQSSRNLSLAAVPLARRSQLEGRLMAILDPGQKRRALNRIASVAVAFLIVCFALPLSAMQLSSQARVLQPEIGQLATVTLSGEIEKANLSSSDQFIKQAIDQAEQQAAQQIKSHLNDAAPSEDAQEPGPESEPDPQAEQDQSEKPVDVRAALNAHDMNMLKLALSDDGPSQNSKAVDALIEALKDSDPDVREQAAWALGLKGDGRAVDPLIAALTDSSSDVRQKAAWSLGLKGDRRAVEPLINALRDEVADVREQAAWSLGLKGDKRAVEPLMVALKDSSRDVREMAAWALGLKGDRRAMNALKEATRDESLEVRKKAGWALGLLLMRYADGDNDSNLDIDVDPQIDRAGRAGRGTGSGIGNGVSGAIPGGIGRGVSGNVSGSVPGGVGSSPGTGIGAGVGRGVSGGVPGGVGTGIGTVKGDQINKPNKSKEKPKQK